LLADAALTLPNAVIQQASAPRVLLRSNIPVMRVFLATMKAAANQFRLKGKVLQRHA
jgi:hypothetical protein